MNTDINYFTCTLHDIIRDVKTTRDVIIISQKYYSDLYANLMTAYKYGDEYSKIYCMYRIIKAVFTQNTDRYYEDMDVYYFPYVQYCFPECVDNCNGDTVIGQVKINNVEYAVVGNCVYSCKNGIGNFSEKLGVSTNYQIMPIFAMQSKIAAEHISKYFGQYIFDLMYYNVLDYEWVSVNKIE